MRVIKADAWHMATDGSHLKRAQMIKEKTVYSYMLY